MSIGSTRRAKSCSRTGWATVAMLGLCAAAWGRERPYAQSTYAPEPAIIDGKLEEPMWQRATKVSLRLANGGQPKEPTTAFLAHDVGNLYIAIRCSESQLDQVKATVTEPDVCGMWATDDNIELFLDPDLDRTSYTQLMINPLGTLYDMVAERQRAGDETIDLPIAIKTGREPKAWVVEMALPFSGLRLDPEAGPVWGLNICRKRGGEWSQWSPTGDYHIPTRFGLVNVPVDLRHLTPVHVLEEGQGIPGRNTLKAEIRNQLRLDRTVRVALTVAPKTGEPREYATVSELAARARTPLALQYDCTGPGPWELSLTIRDERTGQTCQNLLLGQTALRPVLETRLLKPWYRNTIYATTPIREVLCRATVNLPEPERVKARIEGVLLDAAGRTLASASRVPKQQVIELSLPATQLAEGAYRLRVSLKDAAAKALAEAQHSLRKRPPFPSEVVLDERGRFLVNGKPYFPIGMFGGFGGVPEITEVEKQAAEAGFTVYAAGTPRIIHSPQKVMERDNFPEVQKDPLLLGWYAYDEPEIHGPSETPEMIVKEYAKMAEKDPYHPVFVCHCPMSLNVYRQYAGCQDVVMADLYARFTVGGPVDPGFVKRLPFWLKLARDASEGREPVVVILPHFGSQTQGDTGPFAPDSRVATLVEQRAMTYTSVIHGSQGVTWFLYYSGSPWYARWTPNVPRSWEALLALGGELNHLSPALLAPDESDRLTIESSAGEPYATLRTAGGHTVLIAVNPEPVEQEVAFRVAGLGVEHLSVLSEGRRIDVKKGRLTDTFAPYAVHVYTTEKDPDLPIARYLQDESLLCRYTPEEAALLERNLALKRNGAQEAATAYNCGGYFWCGPICAIDGNPITRWAASPKDPNPTLTLKLDRERKLDRAVVKGWGRQKYTLEAHVDGGWKLLAESGKEFSGEYQLDPVRTRQVRFRASSPGPFHVHELELYGEGEKADPERLPPALRKQLGIGGSP